MHELCLLCFLAVLPQLFTASPVNAGPLFQNGKTWEQFLSSVSEQRDLWLSTESSVLVTAELVERVSASSRGLQIVRALTIGSVRDILTIRPLVVGVGGGVTFYGVPPLLQNTHDAHPVSFQLFVRVARFDLTRRMWDMTMAQHAGGHRH